MKTGNKNYLVWEAQTKKEWRKWIEPKWSTINHIKIHKMNDSPEEKMEKEYLKK